jgi:Putative sensor
MTLMMDRVDRAGPAATPARLRIANPVSLLFSATPWACAAYLFSYLLFGVAAFVLCLVTVLVGGVLAVMWIGLPLLCAAFALGQGLAAAERGRARTVGARLNPPVRRPRGTGLRGYLIGRLREQATWRELFVLVVLWPPLLVLDLLALLIWLMGWVLISLPFWYRYVSQRFDNGSHGPGLALGYYPDGPHGSQRYGWYIGDLPSALGAAGVGLLFLALIGNYVVVGAARAHVRTVGRWLQGRR